MCYLSTFAQTNLTHLTHHTPTGLGLLPSSLRLSRRKPRAINAKVIRTASQPGTLFFSPISPHQFVTSPARARCPTELFQYIICTENKSAISNFYLILYPSFSASRSKGLHLKNLIAGPRCPRKHASVFPTPHQQTGKTPLRQPAYRRAANNNQPKYIFIPSQPIKPAIPASGQRPWSAPAKYYGPRLLSYEVP